jgi:hypothetical protein
VDVQIEVYVNSSGFWVLKVALESVESEVGMAAYLHSLLQRHPTIQQFQLNKVTEHWNITPGDGFIYFASTFLFLFEAPLPLQGHPPNHMVRNASESQLHNARTCS